MNAAAYALPISWMFAICAVLLLSACGQTYSACGGLEIKTDAAGRVYVWNQERVIVLSPHLHKLTVQRPDVPRSSTTRSFAVTAHGTIAFVDVSPYDSGETALWLFAPGNSLQYVRQDDRRQDGCCVPNPRVSTITEAYTPEPFSNRLLNGIPLALAGAGAESMVMVTDKKVAWQLIFAPNGELRSQRRLSGEIRTGELVDFASTEGEGAFLAFPPLSEGQQNMLGIDLLDYASGKRTRIGRMLPIHPDAPFGMNLPYDGIAIDRMGNVVVSSSGRGDGDVLLFKNNGSLRALPTRTIPIPNSRGRGIGGVAVGASGLIYTVTFSVRSSYRALGEVVALDPHLNYAPVAKVSLPLSCHEVEI